MVKQFKIRKRMAKSEIYVWKETASKCLEEQKKKIYSETEPLVFQVTDKQKEYLEKHVGVIENWCRKQKIHGWRLEPFEIRFDGNDCVVSF